MDRKKFLLNLTTPHQVQNLLTAIKEESSLPKEVRGELINVIKLVAKEIPQAIEKGLITDKDLDNIGNSNKY